ncbi:MerR family transcriptional regulator [Litoribrevibacter euphylliae]|uniref:MerR family transcriptional regulator n=1 Tax=Litoribrevibacter euphylliae TaxID=1834034 RepID=A0ABV7HL40_9GAMM
MTVSELAKRAGVTADTVRHYVRTGLLIPQRDPNNGYKRFSESHLKRLLFIVEAKSLGFSLPDIQLIFGQAAQGESPCPQVREIMSHRMTEVAKKIEAMQATYRQMEEAMERWKTQPDCIPTGDHICHLIEGFSEGGCCHD